MRNFKGNLLLVHGSGDDNVHFQNSEVLINALVAAGRPFEMMEYPNRTHCICQGKGTQVHLFDLVTRYLDRNLMGASSAACPGARGRGALNRAWRPGGTDPRLQSPLPPEPSMTYEDIVALLGYAGGHEQKVRITTTDRTEVVGIPMSVDTHITAHEVYLRPAGSDDTEIAVSLGAIQAVELV